MKNYNSYINNDYSPIDINQLPYFVDMKGLRNYAQEKGVSISSLTESEKRKFIKQNLLHEKKLDNMISLITPDSIHSEVQCGHRIGKEEI